MTDTVIASTVDAVVEKHFQTKRAFAQKCGISDQLLQKWRKTRIPAERVLGIEKRTGVSRHELRPDLYPRERTKKQGNNGGVTSERRAGLG